MNKNHQTSQPKDLTPALNLGQIARTVPFAGALDLRTGQNNLYGIDWPRLDAGTLIAIGHSIDATQAIPSGGHKRVECCDNAWAHGNNIYRDFF